uniref:Uncharacterized protein n=1 Tax=Eutreptiella gymnastica TaxID=73025 RepID=A0A7S4G5M1_9EUGL|mmetsp:Transcript_45122/g.73618  ORF Transcript_45122/g.73618 Transcript_45122/m.73618 type:complete len:111 (+) Transcript_45122:59-391(+)
MVSRLLNTFREIKPPKYPHKKTPSLPPPVMCTAQQKGAHGLEDCHYHHPKERAQNQPPSRPQESLWSKASRGEHMKEGVWFVLLRYRTFAPSWPKRDASEGQKIASHDPT